MSLQDDLEAIGRVSGVADLALVDFLARGRQALPEAATTADIAKWIGTLRTEAPHLFLQPVVTDSTAQERERILANHPTERMTQARADRTPVQRRPDHRLWTAEERKALDGKSVHERLTAGHAGPPKA